MSPTRRSGARALAGWLLLTGAVVLLALLLRRDADAPHPEPVPTEPDGADASALTPPAPTVDARPVATPDARTQPAGNERLVGRVVVRGGEAVEGVTVEARAMPPPASDELPPLVAKSDADGRFVFVGVAAGTWALRADDPRYARARPVTTTVPPDPQADPDLPTEPLLVLTPLGWIEGSVRRLDGGTLPDDLVVVIAGDEDAALAEVATPVVRGRFRTPGLASRPFTVLVRGPPATRTDPEGRDALVPREVPVVPVRDGEATIADLGLVAGAVFRGRVLDAEGKPVARATLSGVLGGQATSGGPRRTTATSLDDGAFVAAGLAGGRWSFTVHAEGFAERTVAWELEVGQVVERDVTLTR